jgi:hypothetical protein
MYVDKTAYIYRLVQEANPFFLSRPRRFGKSLLLSTLKAYFEGRKDLFSRIAGQPALAVAGLEDEWLEHPVLHIDFNVGEYYRRDGLELALDSNLRQLEAVWGRDPANTAFSDRFRGLIRQAAEKTGRRTVVLIDEYDKPLLETDDEERRAEIRDILRAFYGTLKSADQWLRFYLITGITKFSKVSIFSELNQLEDISMADDYAPLCGVTQAELETYFSADIQNMAGKNDMSFEKTMAELRKHYNGYLFSRRGEKVYNPFSLLNALKKKDFLYYWFETGTPTFLVKTLADMRYDLPSLKGSVRISANAVMDYRFNNRDPVPLLYQSGYLTIKSYNPDTGIYTLGFPNGEVEYGFLNELFKVYSPWVGNGRQGLYIGNFIEDLDTRDMESLMNRFRALFSGIPYPLTEQSEYHYQTLLYLVFTLMGEFAQSETASSAGRSDMVVVRKDTVYVFEFKLSGKGTAEEALEQIEGKGYLLPYSAEGKRLVKVGVEFDREKRTIGRWLTAGGD